MERMWDFMEPTNEIAVSSGMWNDGGSFLDQDLSTWESNSRKHEQKKKRTLKLGNEQKSRLRL